jgi:uncharacterized membrane protein
MITHFLSARPTQALYPLLGTSSAFVLLMAVGFVTGGVAVMASM